MKVAFYTLGCKVNQYDTQIMREKMEGAGYHTVDFEDAADVYIINTCTVTQISDKKSRQMISKVKRNFPQSVIVVCGCYSQVAPTTVAALDGVDIVLGTSNRKDILNYLELFQKEQRQILEVDNCGTLETEEIHSFGEKNRAILKIEDGCENYCSYCLIPFARGKIRSKPLEIIKKETAALANDGYREIVLTGIHLGSYGKENGSPCLEKAIKAVSENPKIERIRLGSLEPRIITESFLKEIQSIKSLCPHFHLSLQSGCDKTLRAMNRHYSAQEYKDAVALLRRYYPDCAVTTDIIVGFPGESEDDFIDSLQFVRKIGFAKIHIFPFSPRSGTKAAAMKEQLTKSIKTERVKKMEEIEAQSRKAFWESLVGTVQTVLPENEKKGTLRGFTPNYCPVRWRGRLSHEPIALKIVAYDNESLIAEEGSDQ